MVAGIARAGEVVVPSAYENLEAPGNNGFPFHLDFYNQFGIFSMRYQQVYSADEFASLTEPVLITEIRFRPDLNEGEAFAGTLHDLQISLSTTPSSPDGLSANFADNVGADDTIVYDGPLSLSSAAHSSSFTGPMEFDIAIVFSTPFLYDPSQGDLLLDVRNYGGGSTTFFDAVFESGDSTSRAITNTVGDVNSTTASWIDSGGLVTNFTYTPADAPPTSLLVAIDVKPGSDDNQVNLSSNGNVGAKSKGMNKKPKGKQSKKKPKQASKKSPGPVLQVAVLTTEDFDATLTDVETVLLGDPLLGGTVTPIKSMIEDVDADGDLDVLMHFSLGEMQDSNAISAESLVLVLTAQTIDGIAIDGMDAVNVKSK